MGIRDSFVEVFGEDEAMALEHSAISHENGVNSKNKGSDPFKWTLLICIGYQCFEIEKYRKYHKISAPYDEIKKWIIENAELKDHDGDCDYLALMGGVYNEYVGIEKVTD